MSFFKKYSHVICLLYLIKSIEESEKKIKVQPWQEILRHYSKE